MCRLSFSMFSMHMVLDLSFTSCATTGEKPTKSHVCPVKTRISLVWSVSLLQTYKVAKGLNYISNSYTTVCPPVHGYNPQVLAYRQTNYSTIIWNSAHQCRPCSVCNVKCLSLRLLEWVVIACISISAFANLLLILCK